MGALGGCFFFLAVTDKMTTSFRIFSVLGALIFGFLAGWAIAPLLDNIVLAAMCACGISALISWFIGSLARWADGGLTHARPPM
jgi:hypothetical protein